MYLWPRQWMGHYSDAVDMSDYAVSASLCWQWRARVCVRVCSCVLCECHYCLLSGSRQVTWLPCLSLCSSLISSAAYLNEWLSSMYGCVCVCVCVQPLQDIVNTQKQFLWDHNLILIFTVQVGKFPSFHPMEAICVHYRILLDTWNVLHMQSHIQYLRLIQVCFWLTVYSFRWDPDAKRCSNQYFYIIRKSDDDVRELLIVTGPLRIITQS